MSGTRGQSRFTRGDRKSFYGGPKRKPFESETAQKRAAFAALFGPLKARRSGAFALGKACASLSPLWP